VNVVTLVIVLLVLAFFGVLPYWTGAWWPTGLTGAILFLIVLRVLGVI
jgi:hypothetical protein